MGLSNKHQIGGCKCCCFARPPVDPNKIAFIAQGSNIQPHDDDRIWPYIGRAEDIFGAIPFDQYQDAATQPGWVWGSSGSALNHGIVVLDPPVAAADFVINLSSWSPTIPDGATIIAHYGTPFGTIFGYRMYEWVVDSHCNRYRLPSLNNPNLRLFRQVTRQPNAPE